MASHSLRQAFVTAILGALCLFVTAAALPAQYTASKAVAPPIAMAGTADLSLAQTKVDVNPVARDEEIRRRLQNVLEATGWFVSPHVRVQSGVVFLEGNAANQQGRTWAGDREIIFPNGIPLSHEEPVPAHANVTPSAAPDHDVVATKAEGGLHSEAAVIEEQARRTRKPGEENLLEPGVSDPHLMSLTGSSSRPR